MFKDFCENTSKFRLFRPIFNPGDRETTYKIKNSKDSSRSDFHQNLGSKLIDRIMWGCTSYIL